MGLVLREDVWEKEYQDGKVRETGILFLRE